MKVLMFGWEFPPHILGGLGTASYGLTKGLAAQSDMDITFCMPKCSGDEDRSFLDLVSMDCVPVVNYDIDSAYLQQRLEGKMKTEHYYNFRNHIYADFRYLGVNDIGGINFSGKYPTNLHEEINNYSIVAGVIARSMSYDLIHAHDWLTYPAGIYAKQLSGKPLVIHVHATDFDRSRGNVNPTVYSIEKDGMDHADCIMCVSELTRQTVINHYHQDPRKCVAMHNAVYPLEQDKVDIVSKRKPFRDRKEKVVTFLGRITMQKGPEYFIEAARLVIERTRDIRFCMAGSGDMMDEMIELAAKKGIADRLHFPGFMRGNQVFEAFRDSDVYVMPSVSEPFGISPLEAMQSGVPSIISKQSGCGEILDYCIKTDYWDINSMADAIYALCNYEGFHSFMQKAGRDEVDQITWEKVGQRIRSCYDKVLSV